MMQLRSTFYRWESWGTENLKNLSRIIINWGTDAEFKLQSYSKVDIWLHRVLVHLSWPEFDHILAFPFYLWFEFPSTLSASYSFPICVSFLWNLLNSSKVQGSCVSVFIQWLRDFHPTERNLINNRPCCSRGS